MAYVADPTNAAEPADSADASGGAAEFRALKAYLQTLLNSGSGIPVTGYAWQGFRNKLINGNFDVWQRGTSLAAGTGRRFIADRWGADAVGSTIAPSRQAFTLGQTTVPFEPQFFHRAVVVTSAGASNYAAVTQRIEGVRTFAGQSAILGFWAKADAVKNIAVEFKQHFGTGGAPSADVNAIAVTTKTLGTDFQYFTVPVTPPSITGKTLGTAGNDFLEVIFWLEAGSTFNARTNSLGQQSGTFDIAQVQLEPGSSATPFELLPPDKIMESCQRFYEKSYNLETAPGTATYTGSERKIARTAFLLGDMACSFRVSKQKNPTITTYSPQTGASGNSAELDASGVFVADRTNGSGDIGQNRFRIQQNGNATADRQYALHWTADAEL